MSEINSPSPLPDDDTTGAVLLAAVRNVRTAWGFYVIRGTPEECERWQKLLRDIVLAATGLEDAP